MFKTIGFAALAAIAALVLGFGTRAGTTTQTAHADTTDVTVIGCEFIVNAIDGDTTDTPTAADVEAACGRGPGGVAGVGTPLPPVGALSIASLATRIGNEDGVLEKSDFNSDSADEEWDQNQISTDCTHSDGTNYLLPVPDDALADFGSGMACTLDVFVFVDRQEPTSIDLPSGLVTIENGLEDFTCTTAVGGLITTDADCETAFVPTALNPSDGVVLFHVVANPAIVPGIGAVLHSRVSQSSVEQAFDINAVGPANQIVLTLAESLIETNGNAANVIACTGDNAAITAISNGSAGTAVTDAIAPPTSTLAWAIATDRNDNQLTRVPVAFKVTPPEDSEIAKIGIGNVWEEVTSNTFFSIHPANPAAPADAAYVTICGGKLTGVTTVRAEINLVSCSLTLCTLLSSRDKSDQELTVGGAPSSNVLTAEASTIKCDGTEKSTVTAKVTDSAGNNVADGVPVSFSVVALGTANPINTVTTDGIATSVITPLSNSSAGVTVIVSAGDNDIASVVQTSVRVDCALPLVTQPTLAPPTATPRSGIAGPDTGNGGYLNQNGSNGFPMWTLIALALGSMTLVAGGLVTRRSGK